MVASPATVGAAGFVIAGPPGAAIGFLAGFVLGHHMVKKWGDSHEST
jgi:hypothetical protein